jgi:hypothetical protein
MQAAKQCRAHADECLRLAQSAQSETEAKLLRSISHSWVRVANQIDRYRAHISSDMARTSRSDL